MLGGALLEDDIDLDLDSFCAEPPIVSPFYDAVKQQKQQQQQQQQFASIASTTTTATAMPELRAVDKLWSYCESSTTSVKLLLADSFSTPYYLPTPRGSKLKQSEVQIAREQARVDFLVRREVSARTSSLGSNSLKSAGIELKAKDASGISSGSTRISGRKENALVEKLLNAYRNDNERRQELFDTINQRKQEKLKAFVEMKRNREINKSLSPTTLPSNVDERIQAVSKRKSLIVETKIDQFESKKEEWKEKIEARSNAETHLGHLRQMRWIVIIVTLNRLKKMGTVSKDRSKIDKRRMPRWQAVMMIQRAVRRYRIRKYGLKVPISSRFRVLTLDHKSVFAQRQEACSLITRFLFAVAGGWKGIISSFVRKVKIIQRRIRLHLATNAQRLNFLAFFLDKIFTAIFTHAQLISNEKGHDLHNMTALDISRIRFQLRAYRSLHIVDDMNSKSYHVFLRKHQKLLHAMTRFFGPSARHHPNVNIDSIKRRVMLDFIYRKRWEFVTRLDSFKLITFHTPTYTVADVKSFINGGSDPLESYLQEMKELQDQRYSEYMEKLKNSKTGRVHRAYSQGETNLLLLSLIKPEDATTIFLRTTEIAMQQLHNLKPGTAISAKSNVLENTDEDRGFLPEEDENNEVDDFDEIKEDVKGVDPRRGSVMPTSHHANKFKEVGHRKGSVVPSSRFKDEGELRPVQPISDRRKSVMLLSPRGAKIRQAVN